MLTTRFRTLGFVLAAFGMVFLIGGGYAWTQVSAGYDSLEAVSYTHLTLPTILRV